MSAPGGISARGAVVANFGAARGGGVPLSLWLEHAARRLSRLHVRRYLDPMVQYDARVIYEFADRLYKQAGGLAATYAIAAGFLTGLGGWITGSALPKGSFYTASTGDIDGAAVLAPLGLVIGLVVGGVVGYGRGFTLRLQAQQALCQVKIQEGIDSLRASRPSVFQPPT